MSRLIPSQPQGFEPALLTFNVEELMAVSIRLAEILNEESALLAAMDISGMAKLHPEKLKLTQILESYQALLRAQPDVMEDVPDAMREKLVQVIVGFGQVMEHNFRQVTTAKVVNHKVVQAITDSLAEQQHLTVYNKTGNHFRAGVQMSGVSININQKA
jgi:hypothetical protein